MKFSKLIFILCAIAMSVSAHAQTKATDSATDEENQRLSLLEMSTVVTLQSNDSVKQVLQSYMEDEDSKAVLTFLDKEGVKADQLTMDMVPMNGPEMNYLGNSVKITPDFSVNIGGHIVRREPNQTPAEYWMALYKQGMLLKAKKGGSHASHTFLRYLLPDAMAIADWNDVYKDIFGGLTTIKDGVVDIAVGGFHAVKGVAEVPVAAVGSAASGVATLATKAWVASGAKDLWAKGKAWVHDATGPDKATPTVVAVVTCTKKGEYLMTTKNKAGADRTIKMTPAWLAHHHKAVASAKDNKKCTPDLAKKYGDSINTYIAAHKAQPNKSQAPKRVPASTDEK
jgi:hypothetical protein